MNVAKGVFFILESLRREPVFQCLKELERNQWLKRSEVKDLQWSALTRLVRHAYRNVPYYRYLFDSVRIVPSDMRSLEDFRRIPLLTKTCLRDNFRQMLAKERKERLYTATTSGTTGLPLTFYRDGRSVAYSLAAMYRGHRWYGLDIGAKEAMLWSVPIDWKGRVGTRVKDFLLNRFRARECDLHDENFFHFSLMMKKKRPDYLMGIRSLVYPFAIFLKEQEIDGRLFELKMVKCTAEVILDCQKQLIESTFGCKMASEYGSSETGVIAFECPEGSLHLMDDCVYVEFVDEADHLESSRRKARVVVTNLHNYSMPILRYDLGDMGVASHRSCTCGRGLALMESIEGRISDQLITPDGKGAHASLFYFIVQRLTEKGFVIKQWRVYQTAVNELKIKIVKGPDFSNKALAYMDRKIHQRLGSGMNIHYEFVADIPRESSGKLKNFVSLLTPD